MACNAWNSFTNEDSEYKQMKFKKGNPIDKHDNFLYVVIAKSKQNSRTDTVSELQDTTMILFESF